jgi:hypothetical protein
MNPNALPPVISTHCENKRIKLTNPDISTDVENKSVSTDTKNIGEYMYPCVLPYMKNQGESLLSSTGDDKSISADNKCTGEYMYTYGLTPCMENQGGSRKSTLSSTGDDKSISAECEHDVGVNVKKLDESEQEKLDAMVREAHVYNITRFMGGGFYMVPR